MANLEEMRQQFELLNDEQLISIVQEHDSEQWRPEVFDVVNAILKTRGVSPDKDLQRRKDMPDENAGLALVTVAEYFNYVDAETDRLALEAKGIKVWICNESNPLAEGIPPGVQLQVRSDDLAAAMAAFESEPVPSTDLPEEIAEPPCPKCGSRKVIEEAEITKAAADASHFSPKQVWLYNCASCGHKWPES